LAALAILYRSSQQIPDFYRQAISVEPQEQAAASQKMIEQTANLASHAQQPGAWEALFTVEQINGWLAVDLVKNHANALPPEVSDPRISITPEQVSLGCRWTGDGFSTIFSMHAELYLAEPNVIALRVQGAHAGALPLPLADILDGITQAAEELNLRIRWLMAERDPIALITIPQPEGDEHPAVQIESLELREGAIYLAGRTLPRAAESEAAEKTVEKAAADQPAFQQKVQR
jgi:hypothetical protein